MLFVKPRRSPHTVALVPFARLRRSIQSIMSFFTICLPTIKPSAPALRVSLGTLPSVDAETRRPRLAAVSSLCLAKGGTIVLAVLSTFCRRIILAERCRSRRGPLSRADIFTKSSSMSSSRCSTLRDFLALMLAFRAQNLIWYHRSSRSQVEEIAIGLLYPSSTVLGCRMSRRSWT